MADNRDFIAPQQGAIATVTTGALERAKATGVYTFEEDPVSVDVGAKPDGGDSFSSLVTGQFRNSFRIIKESASALRLATDVGVLAAGITGELADVGVAGVVTKIQDALTPVFFPMKTTREFTFSFAIERKKPDNGPGDFTDQIYLAIEARIDAAFRRKLGEASGTVVLTVDGSFGPPVTVRAQKSGTLKAVTAIRLGNPSAAQVSGSITLEVSLNSVKSFFSENETTLKSMVKQELQNTDTPSLGERIKGLLTRVINLIENFVQREIVAVTAKNLACAVRRVPMAEYNAILAQIRRAQEKSTEAATPKVTTQPDSATSQGTQGKRSRAAQDRQDSSRDNLRIDTSRIDNSRINNSRIDDSRVANLRIDDSRVDALRVDETSPSLLTSVRLEPGALVAYATLREFEELVDRGRFREAMTLWSDRTAEAIGADPDGDAPLRSSPAAEELGRAVGAPLSSIG